MRYEKYKSSGIEWIGEIPSHWEEKKFRYVFSFGRGLSITKENLQDNGVPCVSYGEIHSRYGFEVNPDKHSLRCVSEDYLNSSPNSLLKKGDFVFADTSEDIEGSGNFTYLNSDVPVFAGYHTIVAKPSQKFIYRYIAYFLDSIDYRTQIRRVVNGTKVYSITQSILKGTNIILPPIPEQTTIANFLDEKTSQIDKLISNKQKLIELLKEERTAIINEAVSGKGKNWERKKLKYLTEIISKGTTPSTVGAEIIAEGEIRFLKAENILPTNSVSSSPNNFIDAKTNEIIKRSELKENDVLIVIAGATIGKVGILQKDLIPANTNQAVCFVRLKNKELAKWIWFYLQSNTIKETIMLDAVQSAQPNLSMEKLGNFVILMPTDKERKEVEEHIQNEIQHNDETVSKIEKEIELMNEYRTALISEVVTGKIKVA